MLRRPKFSATIHEATIREFAAGIAAISEIATDPPTTAARSRDQKDDYLLELAIVANVDVLISGDRDLTDLESPGAYSSRHQEVSSGASAKRRDTEPLVAPLFLQICAKHRPRFPSPAAPTNKKTL